MGLPKVDINSLMSSVEKQNNFYDEVLTSLNHIEIILSQMFHLIFSEDEDYKLTSLICEFDNLMDSDPTAEELANELKHQYDYLFSEEDFLATADEVLGGNE